MAPPVDPKDVNSGGSVPAMEQPRQKQQQQLPPATNQHSSGKQPSAPRSKRGESSQPLPDSIFSSTVVNYGSEIEDMESDESWEFPAEDSGVGRKNRNVIIQAVNVDDMGEEDFPDTRKDCTKSQNDVASIIQQINSVILFQGYEDDELKSVIQYMYKRKVAKGEVVIRQGEEGDAFYVIRSGKYDCTVLENGKEVSVCTYNGSGYFGDLALIHHAPRAATITAATNGELWVLNATRYVWLKRRQAVLNAERFEQVIRQIPMFSNSLSNSLISRLIDAIEVLTLRDRNVICRQGEPGNAMYFILDGGISVVVNGKEVCVMKPNEFFGERALILDEGRAATCSAKGNTKLAKLPKESFELLIPDAVVAKMRQYVTKAYASKAPPKD